MAGLQVVRSAVLAGLVRPASEYGEKTGTGDRAGVDRVLPVLPGLREILPGRGLRRGTTIAVRPGRLAGVVRHDRPAEPTDHRAWAGAGAGGRTQQPEGGAAVGTSLVLALLAEASRTGAWCAVVGVPALGALAAAELGIALERLALVPYPGPEWAAVVAALVDGVDVVVAAPPGPVASVVAGRLAARARQRGCVLVPYGRWSGADVTLESVRGVWEGLGQGRGRLYRREVTISARGRGAAARPKQIQVWLPAPMGGFAPVAGRPALTVVDGLAGTKAAGVETDVDEAV
jgi:hypothetical protein